MTHAEKFIQLTLILPNIYIDRENFAKRLNHKRPTSVDNWLSANNPNSTNRAKIAEIFGLKADIWIEKFSSNQEFKRRVESGEFNIITKEMTIQSKIENIIIDSSTDITKEERNMLQKNNLEEDIDLNSKLEGKSAPFIFEFAKKLKSENRAKEALEVLEILEKEPSSFKYSYYNQIEHLKAILLSHESIQEWQKAIDILKRLYSSAKYHLEEPEIITLIASNYKRKALHSQNGEFLAKESVDLDLISQSLALYKEAYNLKDSQAKYYDAINYAYLYRIATAIEEDLENSVEISNLYNDLSKVWRVDTHNWWEMSSKAEFLMLLGKVDEAIFDIENFLEMEKIEKFELNATLRQLKLYIHFTADKDAIKFYESLKIAYDNIF